MSLTAEPTSVYRYFDQRGQLIYIGITNRGTTRNGEHYRSKDWWPFVSKQTVEHFPDREAAHAREVELIERFAPPFNTQHNRDAAMLRAAYFEFEARRDDLPTADQILQEHDNRVPLRVLHYDPTTLEADFVTRLDHFNLVRSIQDEPRAGVRIFRGRMVGYIRGTKRRGPFLLLRGRLSRDVPLDDPRAWCTCVNQKHRTFRVRRIELGAR